MSLKSDDAYITQLQAILCIAHGLGEVAAASCPPSNTPSAPSYPPAIVDSIRLPSPRPLLPLLLEAGVGHEIACTASKIYLHRAEELRHSIQKSILATWCKIAELPVIKPALSPELLIRKVVSTSTELYLHRLAEWKEEITRRVKQAPSAPSRATQKNAFNHGCVPLLEHFFEENPFPTHADKMFLAKKSNMEYKQIHVWFQNRRNRTKEGKTLRKKPMREGVTKPLDKLYERMEGHIIGSGSKASQTSQADPVVATAKNNMNKDAFTSVPPPHAFPSSYPPTCHYDPFPCKSGPVCFEQPEWRRSSHAKRPLVSTSIDDLVDKFSHLNVRAGSRSKASPKLHSHAATVAITVIPTRAPHPSLVAPVYSQPTKLVQLRSLTRAPVSRSKAFQSPNPNSTPITLVPLPTPHNKSEPARKRKVAPLPQRLPGRIRSACRDTSPSDSSSTSSSSPCLFSMDIESRSCSDTSISSLSTPSDAASIPELPCLFESPRLSPFESPIHLHDSGDMAASSPPSIS